MAAGYRPTNDSVARCARPRHRPDSVDTLAGVVAFASPEWIAALDAAARDHTTWPDEMGAVHLTVEQVLTDGTAWHLVIDGGTWRVHPGRAASPTVTFTQTRELAAAIARGDQSAQAAFRRGDLRVGGDTRALVEHASTLAAVEDVFASVRADTEV
jgi:hypothetical protein